MVSSNTRHAMCHSDLSNRQPRQLYADVQDASDSLPATTIIIIIIIIMMMMTWNMHRS